MAIDHFARVFVVDKVSRARFLTVPRVYPRVFHFVVNVKSGLNFR